MEIVLKACELIKSVAKEFNKIPNNWENAQQIWEYKKQKFLIWNI